MPEEAEVPYGLSFRDGKIQLRFPEIGTFRVAGDGTGEVMVEPEDGAHPDIVKAQIDGPVFGLRQHLLGRLVLHASAVARDGRAVAFLGGRQWGKSTTAAVMLRSGWTLVTDDILPLEFTDDGVPLCHPGPARIKLWPDAARKVGLDPDDLPRLYPGTEKRLYHAETIAEPAELAAVMILVASEREEDDVEADGPDEADHPADGHGDYEPDLDPSRPFQRLSGAQAMIELVRHTYRPNDFEAVLPDDHFPGCAKVVRRVPVAFVRVPSGADPARTALEEAIAALLGDEPSAAARTGDPAAEGGAAG